MALILGNSGPRNLITDVPGISVGNSKDGDARTGVTAVLCEEPAVAAVQVLGGAPGTRETDLLEPHNMVQTVDAVVLSGGSAFGLDAASGAQTALYEMGRGYQVGPHRVPIVPAAILFDLWGGGPGMWGSNPPFRELGAEALRAAEADFELGSHGAGTGALSADLKGGLGSASVHLQTEGITVGALAAANPSGTVTVGGGRHFWAAPFEVGEEFGGLGMPSPLPETTHALRLKFRETEADLKPYSNTTLAVVATDAQLTKAQCKRLAIAAHDGFARAIWPSHTPMDGDLVFALSTGRVPLGDDPDIFSKLCAAAASTTTRAIARGVHAAAADDGDILPAWSTRR